MQPIPYSLRLSGIADHGRSAKKTMNEYETVYSLKRGVSRIGFSAGTILLIVASVKAAQIGEFLASAIYVGFSVLTSLFVYRAEDLLIERCLSGDLRITRKTTFSPVVVTHAEIRRIRGVQMISSSIGRNQFYMIRLELDLPNETIQLSRYPINKKWHAEQITKRISRILNQTPMQE